MGGARRPDADAHAFAHAGLVGNNAYAMEGAMTPEGMRDEKDLPAAAVMVVVEDGRLREVRLEPLERLLPLLVAVAARSGEVRLEEEDGSP